MAGRLYLFDFDGTLGSQLAKAGQFRALEEGWWAEKGLPPARLEAAMRQAYEEPLNPEFAWISSGVPAAFGAEDSLVFFTTAFSAAMKREGFSQEEADKVGYDLYKQATTKTEADPPSIEFLNGILTEPGDAAAIVTNSKAAVLPEELKPLEAYPNFRLAADAKKSFLVPGSSEILLPGRTIELHRDRPRYREVVRGIVDELEPSEISVYGNCGSFDLYPLERSMFPGIPLKRFLVTGLDRIPGYGPIPEIFKELARADGAKAIDKAYLGQ